MIFDTQSLNVYQNKYIVKYIVNIIDCSLMNYWFLFYFWERLHIFFIVECFDVYLWLWLRSCIFLFEWRIRPSTRWKRCLIVSSKGKVNVYTVKNYQHSTSRATLKYGTPSPNGVDLNSNKTESSLSPTSVITV